MRIHVFQHVPFETLGMIQDWAEGHIHIVTYTRFFDTDFVIPPLFNYDMLIILGGPMSVNDTLQHSWLSSEKENVRKAIDAGKIVLGICLGAQMIASCLGAKVCANKVKEIGWFPVEIEDGALGNPIITGINTPFNAFHWHGETFDLPQNALHLMSSAACHHQAFLFKNQVLGLQFHLEMGKADIKRIIKCCGNELIPDIAIQDATTINKKSVAISSNKQILVRLLENLISA
jgi:GMP synthase-like glutamine amidotransferase